MWTAVGEAVRTEGFFSLNSFHSVSLLLFRLAFIYFLSCVKWTVVINVVFLLFRHEKHVVVPPALELSRTHFPSMLC